MKLLSFLEAKDKESQKALVMIYIVEGTREEISSQISYCFNMELDLKTFDEAMKSLDASFWERGHQ